MAKLIKSVASLSLTVGVLVFSSNSVAKMDPYVESALIDTCKAAISDKNYKLNKTISSYRLSTKDVALKVMCNNVDIIAFAEQHGAYKTADKLQRSVGNVSISDFAAVTKINVNF